MTKKIQSVLLVLALGAGVMACGGSEETAAPTAAPAAPSAPAAPAAAAPAAPAAAAPAGGGAPIAVAGPGFTFTPVSGTAGGPTEGSQLGEDCIGQFPTAPQHTISVGAAIPLLRVLVNAGADADTTLAVRTPGGQVLCNDDSGDPANSLNPAVDVENAAPGEYQIYVGGYSSGDSWARYQLGLGETAEQAPSAVVPAP